MLHLRSMLSTWKEWKYLESRYQDRKWHHYWCFMLPWNELVTSSCCLSPPPLLLVSQPDPVDFRESHSFNVSSSLRTDIPFQNCSTLRPSGVLRRSAHPQSIMDLYVSFLFKDRPSYFPLEGMSSWGSFYFWLLPRFLLLSIYFWNVANERKYYWIVTSVFPVITVMTIVKGS